MTATPDQIAYLQSINDRINAIPYSVVLESDAKDEWVDTPTPGASFECRCFAIAKAKLLREQGWPVEDMSEVLLNDELGAWHAVLAVKAGGDTYILDNRAPAVYLWTKPPYQYTWLSQQIPGTIEYRDASTGLI